MRRQHELERGIVCEKCRKIAHKGFYKRIKVETAITTSTTGENKVIYRMNLCDSCYDQYCSIILKFLDSASGSTI